MAQRNQFCFQQNEKEISVIKSTHFKILRTHFDFIKQTQSLTEKKKNIGKIEDIRCLQ